MEQNQLPPADPAVHLTTETPPALAQDPSHLVEKATSKDFKTVRTLRKIVLRSWRIWGKIFSDSGFHNRYLTLGLVLVSVLWVNFIQNRRAICWRWVLNWKTRAMSDIHDQHFVVPLRVFLTPKTEDNDKGGRQRSKISLLSRLSDHLMIFCPKLWGLEVILGRRAYQKLFLVFNHHFCSTRIPCIAYWRSDIVYCKPVANWNYRVICTVFCRWYALHNHICILYYMNGLNKHCMF